MIKVINIMLFTYYVLKYRQIYIHIDELPVKNYFKIRKGHLNYLYIKNTNRKFPVAAFLSIFNNMSYQFKHLDNSYLRAKADLSDYKSKYARTNNKRWLNEYNTLKNKIDNWPVNELELNEFTEYIELNFKQPIGSFDVNMSTSRAFSAFHKAKMINLKNKK
jgi:hypothetical protein